MYIHVSCICKCVLRLSCVSVCRELQACRVYVGVSCMCLCDVCMYVCVSCVCRCVVSVPVCRVYVCVL